LGAFACIYEGVRKIMDIIELIIEQDDIIDYYIFSDQLQMDLEYDFYNMDK
jgi:hypothetical protein